MKPFLRGLGMAAFLAGVGRLLVAGPVAGRSERPGDLSWATLDSWYQQVGPAVAVAEAIRLAALVLTLWLAVAIVLQALVSVPHLQVARPAVDRITPRALQRALHGVAGVSFAAMVAVPGGDLPVAEPPPDVAVMQVIEDGAPLTSSSSSTSTTSPPQVTASITSTTATTSTTSTTSEVTTSTSPPPVVTSTTTVDPASAPTTTVPVPAPAAPPTAAPSVPLPTALTPTAVVQGGDSFWTIAEAQLQRRGWPPSERDVVRYWERLVATNVTRLVDPTNPDLLYPGQVLELPPV